MELLKGLIKWIILIILFIIIVVLIIKFANRSETTKKQTNESTVNVVENNNNSTDTTDVETDTDTDEDGLESIQEDQTVYSPDTASTGVKETILGILIISGGIVYIRNHKTVKGNS